MIKIELLKNVGTLQELKKEFYRLVKIYHPDNGATGNLETMQKLNNEYEYLKKTLKNEANTEKKHFEDIHSMDIFKEIITDLLQYENLIIDIVGSWLWLSGSGTYEIKDAVLKEKYGMKWSKKNKKWYYYNGIKEDTGRYKGGFLDKKISEVGKTTIKSEEKKKLK